MDSGLAGKTAIVTGGASGIGLACVRALAAEGVRVAVADLDVEAAREVATARGASGAIAVGVDVTSAEDVSHLVAETVERFGGLDVLVACAGTFTSTPFERIEQDEWDRMQAVNLRGVFLVAQAALRVMAARRSGRIVTIGSLAGQAGGPFASAAYAASKAAVIGLTKAIAHAAGPYGVTANCVNPGIIDTPMTAGWPAELVQARAAASPLGRIGRPEEVAAAVVFLASQGASFVHGTHIDVNGGLFMD